ncbi:MAG: hypothetical protein WC329_05780 [Candidatus Omnitrophota bacterium]|jgi:hypothetical protein
MRKLNRNLQATCEAPVTIEAAKDATGQPTFSILAYTGGAMKVSGWGGIPVVIDLAGLSLGAKSSPVLLNHDSRQIVGHSTNKTKGMKDVRIDGTVSGAGAAALEVVESAKRGFPWQASVGVDVLKAVEYPEGRKALANGMEFEGPVIIARKAKLYETSFVALGADEHTTAKVAAEADFLDVEQEENNMDDLKKSADLEAAKAVEEAKKLEAEKASEAAKKAEMAKLEAAKPSADDIEKRIVEASRAEAKRQGSINAACKSFPEIAEKAIAEGLTVEAAKAQMYDAIQARQGASVGAAYVNTGAGGEGNLAKTLEAAAILATGGLRASKIEDHFEEKTLEAADKFRSAGLKGIIHLCCQAEGQRLDIGASPNVMAAIGFSTVSLPQLLSNVANKRLRDAYTAAPSTVNMLFERLSATDFKTNAGITLGGMGRMEKVQNGGPLKAGTITEEPFTYRVNTVGKTFGLTREMIANDDLGGFVRQLTALGQSAYNTLEYDGWALVEANTGSFFSEGNANLITDTLSISGLSTAELYLDDMKDIDGVTPINLAARWLVVPPALHPTAREIFTSTRILGTSGTDGNIYANTYEPVKVRSLTSALAWYLWPEVRRPFGVAYLNGVEAPVVEEVTPDPQFLGRTWRGYFDFGVCQVDKRSCIKSDGTGAGS